MTREDHISGSDRVMEVADKYGWADDDVVINVQGDELGTPDSDRTAVRRNATTPRHAHGNIV